MSLPVFPDELLPVTRTGYRQVYDENRRVTQPEQGPFRAASKFSRADRTLNGEFIASRAGRAAFERFFEDELKFGAKPFLIRDFATDGWLVLDGDETPLTDDADAPLLLSEWHIAVMKTQPDYRALGIEFVISFTYAVKPS